MFRRVILAACGVLVLTAAGRLEAQARGWEPTAGHTQVPIWPDQPPDARADEGPETATVKQGFSAGGHLVAAISTHFERRLYPPMDAADQESCRPDFAVALYPGHLWLGGDGNPALNPEVPVTAQTPPTFLVQAEDDRVDDIENSLVYFAALKKAGVSVEMHVYAHGGHAFGLRRTASPITEWPRLMEGWLAAIGMIPR